MIKNKKIIIIIIIIIVVAVVGFVVYRLFIKNNEPEFVLGKVVRGTVSKEISETGAVKISEETNLGFRNVGRIEKIYVKVGDEIKAGQNLAKLGTNQLYIELTEAQADLEVTKAKKKDAEVSLENARQNLKDIEAKAQEDLDNAYGDATSVLDAAYLEINNAFNLAESIQQTYFTINDQDGIVVREAKDRIARNLERAGVFISEEDIDTALAEIKKLLENTSDGLKVIRDATEIINYRNVVSSTNKTSLDNQKSDIITALTDIIDAQQAISTAKIINEKNINSAKAEIFILETQLEQTGLYPAQINQVLAKISVLENKIQEAVLKSPDRGQITKINKREGEMAQPTDSVISFLASAPFQVEADIYEEDIVNVKVGNSVKITLAAFPGETLNGKVISIDPAEKIINGIVYYEVNINFEEQKEGIKPGMTADIVIEGEKKENILVISKNALEKRDGKKIVRVFKDSQIEEREIEIGLEGDESIEVVSGLEEGENIIIGQ